MTETTRAKGSKGPYVHLDLSFHLQRETKFDYTFDDDDAASMGSSVKSGLRNSLHSSYDFTDMKCLEEYDVNDGDSFGGDDESKSMIGDIMSWRMDPAISGSDFTMSIESVPDGAIKEYHVHKQVLTRGSRKCDFFVSLFTLSKEKRVKDKGDSVIKIHTNAAHLIPQMLDYLYSPSQELTITTASAVGLKHLSEFFGICALAKRAVSFIYDNMSIKNIQTYLLCASAFDDLQIQKLCARKCAESIEQIDPYSELMAEMDPSFLLDVISCHQAAEVQCSYHLSKIVAVYCKLNRTTMGGAVFEELTTAEFLPVISDKCALDLMLLEAGLVFEARDEEVSLTDLQRRCVKSLAPMIHFQTGLTDREKRARMERLTRLPKKVLVQLLLPALGGT